MTDDEAEALLMALGSQLIWHIPLLRDLRATYQDGEFVISPSQGKYACCFAPRSGRRSNQWGHRTPDLAIAKRACDWHVAKGAWPTEFDEGWEFLKQ